jgi:hypothetical protein
MSIVELTQYELSLISGGQAEETAAAEDDPAGAPDVQFEGEATGTTVQ